MNEVVFNTLKNKDFIIKNFILKVSSELDLSRNDLVLLIFFTNQDIPLLDIDNIRRSTYMSEQEIMESFSKLIGIGLITMNVVKDSSGVRNEIISLDNLYKNISMDITKKAKDNNKANIFEIFEREFARPLSPMEYEVINDWLNKGISEDLILEALKESIFNGVKSMRYISKILLTWESNGYKTVDDVKNSYKNKNDELSNTLLFEYNWLDEE